MQRRSSGGAACGRAGVDAALCLGVRLGTDHELLLRRLDVAVFALPRRKNGLLQSAAVGECERPRLRYGVVGDATQEN